VVRFEQIEARVLGARAVVVEGDVRADGALDAELHGRVAASPGNRLTAAWTGRLRGKAVDLRLQSDGRTLVMKSGGEEARAPAAMELNHALLIGLVRMGLYHNLARAAGLRGPDRDSGGIEHWIHEEYFHLVHVLGPPEPGAAILSFDVLADGVPATTTRIWLDPSSGLPARREQTYALESGAATMVETYTRFVVE